MRRMAFGFALLLSLASAAFALDRRMIVINESSASIIGLYASDVDKNAWNYNMLDGAALRPGHKVVANMDSGEGYCMFDLMARLSDGRRAVKYNVNVCSAVSWTITD